MGPEPYAIGRMVSLKENLYHFWKFHLKNRNALSRPLPEL
jgi:hypothetical protein